MNRTLLFLPGAGADPAFWRPLGDQLPKEWRKIYLGWPGIGHQPPHPEVNGFDDIVSLVEKQMGDGPVDLLAQSMGGAVALKLAIKWPKRVRKLVLAVTAGGIDVKSLGASDWRPAYRQEYPKAAAWIMETRPDFTAQLSQATQPTLLLFGDSDPISPVAVGQKLQQLLPNSELVVIPRGDHAFVNERPGEVVDLISRHLAS